MVYLFLANGTEELEFITVLDVLRRAGVKILSVSSDCSERVRTGAHGIEITADITADRMEDDCEMVIVPGGMQGVTEISETELFINKIKDMYANDKAVAAICAGPMVLAKADVLEGKKATVYPGLEKYIETAGAVHIDDSVVIDGNVITSQGPGTAMAFAFAIVEFLKDAEIAGSVKADMLEK